LKDPDSAIDMGKNARRFIENNSPENHYQDLMKIYRAAISAHAQEKQ